MSAYTDAIARTVDPLTFLEGLPLDYSVHTEADLLDLLFTLGYNAETPYMRRVRDCFESRRHEHQTGNPF